MKTSNHAAAPLCAAFVSAMRAEFGADLRPTWVREGSFTLGAPMQVTDLASVEFKAGKKKISYMAGRLA